MFALLFWVVLLGVVFLLLERLPMLAEYKMALRGLAIVVLVYMLLCTFGLTGHPLPMPRWPSW